jgi:hypothetical protein
MHGQYRLTQPTLALVVVNGHHEAITVPTETIVDLDGRKFNGERLMEVSCEGRKLLMFTEDLRVGTVAV